MENQVQKDFECVEEGCTNRVSVYQDGDKCRSCSDKNQYERLQESGYL